MDGDFSGDVAWFLQKKLAGGTGGLKKRSNEVTK
jgi:hypothetical protein